MGRPGSRRKARELALKALYMFEIQGDLDKESMRLFWEEKTLKPDIKKRAEFLVEGVKTNIKKIDAKIEAAGSNWKIARMSRVDRNVLRIAIFEMMFESETPKSVCIDEAIEIARTYGDTKSPAFINGILDRVSQGIEKNAP